MSPIRGLGERVEAALEELKEALAERIRAEQTLDQLTGLPNLVARDELLQELLTKSDDFAVAFIEVDRFKSINSKFGYEPADALLRLIAEELGSFAREAFSAYEGAAFRPHGDEFFIILPRFDRSSADTIHAELDRLRQQVARLSIDVQGTQLTCTVTVGWVAASDLQGTSDRSAHGVLDAVELAVGAGKSKRDCVTRYSVALRRNRRASVRTDCNQCGASFSVDSPREQLLASSALSCPVCSYELAMPPVPGADESVIVPTEI